MSENRFVLDTNAVIFLTTKGNLIHKKETIALRRSNRLKLPDCIVAATAIVLNAVLLTADTGLLRLAWSGYIARSPNE